MNKKGKNKKVNKNQPQNVEVPAKIEPFPEGKVEVPAKIEHTPASNVTETVDISNVAEPNMSNLVEIVSGVLTPEGQDAPKTPKRNKGKKKKGKDDILDYVEDTQKEETDNDKTDTFIAVEQKPSEITTTIPSGHEEIVIPSARKKKNKKKHVDQNEESALSQIKTVPDDREAITLEDTPKTDTQDQIVKAPKKKNKKKKRNDSERSDKDDTSPSTVAFQKILDDKGEFEETTKSKNEDLPLEESAVDVQEFSLQTKLKENIEKLSSSNPTSLIDCSWDNISNLQSNEEIKEIPKSDSKNKKKNKKDKKPAKVECEPLKLDSNIDEEINIPASGVIEEKREDSNEIKIEEMISDESLKPTTKIAKPVEKKRKGKHSDKSDSMTENTKSEITEPTECKDEAIIEVIDILNIPFTTESSAEPKIEDLNIPDNAMGKKRKKSPKIPKQTEVSEVVVVPKTDTKIDFVNEPQLIETVTEQTECVIPEIGPAVMQEASTEGSFTCIKNIPENMPEITGVSEKDTLKFETKPGKKRKKSPKLPKSEIKRLPTTEPDTKRIDTNIKVEARKLDDIEIRSLKTDESEGSGYDAAPEVLYPRSTSQQHIDDNNNMFIREMLPLESSILSEPIVLGSVETPKTPEPITDTREDIKENVAASNRLQSSNNATDDRKSEKTDLKSKMMEVNQDMEELRLSIEKSLAEFTAIEKNEEAVEKRFEEKQVLRTTPTENVSEIQSEPPIEVKTEGIAAENRLNKDDYVIIADTTVIKETDQVDSNLNDLKPNVEKVLQPIEKIIEASLSTDNKSQINKPDIKRTEVEPLKQILNDPSSTTLQTDKISNLELEQPKDGEKQEPTPSTDVPPVCPARKDHKGKHKKRKGKHDSQTTSQESTVTQANTTTPSNTKTDSKDTKDTTKDKPESKTETTEKGKQKFRDVPSEGDYEPIDNFEDALSSSIDDVNQTFDMILEEANEQSNPKINIIAPDEEKTTKITPPKNLLGRPDIPVPSNRDDYKKEKNKIPNDTQARVKIKDSMDVEKNSKNTQTVTKIFVNNNNDNEEYVYKYSFRKVFLQSACHVCKKELKQRVGCGYCNLLFYCSVKHKDEDWPRHQALCFAVSTIVHLKDQKYIYSDLKNITGQDYRLVRMQMIVSCEKILKRRLVPWEQEALLYPRICALTGCREWRQSKLKDCDGCGQISFCSDKPDHFPKTHQRWCKSYSLYQKLVCYQQTQGRLEPKLPSRVMQEHYQIPDKINEVLASMYEEKIDMMDIQYAALTQLATAPLTAAYSHQLYRTRVHTPTNGISQKSSFTIHVVGAELQFEADALNKWEVFFLHLRPDLRELRVVLVNYNLNPSNLPLDLLGKVKVCEDCRQKKRRVVFSFQDKRTYPEYRASDDFVNPDLICAFNPSIQRSSIYNGEDPWPSTILSILKLKTPLLVTGYTMTELQRDIARIKECELSCKVISEPKFNAFASVRPDRNFISDDEMPLLFKNYCYTILCG